jgi:hypothetical protein
MTATICVEVSFGQLAVFSSSLDQPFNDWTDRHVAQGFSWRPGSVSFLCMVTAGQHAVEITVADHVGTVSPGAVRVIEVPFEVPALDRSVEVGSIGESVVLSLPAGSYLLRCEFIASTQSARDHVRLTFARKDTPRFAVVLADSGLSAAAPLLMEARAARA